MDKFSPNLCASNADSLREAFGKALIPLAQKNKNFVVFDADVAGGTGSYHFRNSFPQRFFQFGIAEQNMMSVAAGMSTLGVIPIVSTFAVFCLRAYEQIRLSVCFANRNVKIIGSHPGLDVGPDGASAQALEDLSAFRSLPNLTVISPGDPYETEQATEAILEHNGPVYMRTGRSPAPTVLDKNYKFEIGNSKEILDGNDVTICATGIQLSRALKASRILAEKRISARVVNVSTIKPIDSKTILKCASETGCCVTTEDHSVIGGLGGAVAEVLAKGFPVPLEINGINDTFGESGEPEELACKYGIGAEDIARAAIRAINRKST